MGRVAVKIGPFGKAAIVLGHALVGWAYCGALMGVGMALFPERIALVVHAAGAPIGFAAISWLYFGRFAFTSPLRTACIFLGVVVVLDVLVVAMLVEKSFAMFASPLGTWLPFALIFAATYLVGVVRARGHAVS